MDAIVKGWPKDVELTFADRLYEATPETIVSLIRAAPPKAHALLVIGHNPGLHETARMLVAAGDVERREKLTEKFPTAALAVIDFPIDSWTKLHSESGRLDRYVTPKAIAAEAR
jgi:phosphohistidine phosphatase